MDNLTLLTVHEKGIAIKNRFPQVQAAVEPLKVGIDWSDGQSRWKSVRLGSFTRAGGGNVDIRGSMPEFRPEEGNVVKTVDFKFLEDRDVPCRCEIIATLDNGKQEVVGFLDVGLTGSRLPQRKPPAKPTSREKLPESA